MFLIQSKSIEQLKKIGFNNRKELRELGVIGLLILILYLTGLHTDVAAFAQRVILETGLITPSTETVEDVYLDYDFELKTLEGEHVSFRQFENKVVFINLWATWCPPCIAEMPGIQDLYSSIDHDDIEFVMITIDRDTQKPPKFIERKGYTFPVYYPEDSFPELLRAPSIPTTFVFDKSGKLISKKVGMAKYNRKSFRNFLIKHAEEL